MINEQCFSSGWLSQKRAELSPCDPVLLEKSIYAFALLDALAGKGLDFVFKGGTSLLLRLPRIRRLSIDVDILCEAKREELDPVLSEIGRLPPFVGMKEDERGPGRLPARRHFKYYYRPLDRRNPAPFVILDVVSEGNIYPRVERLPIKTSFVDGDGTLIVPTIEGLLGDKLTAFGPTTTGIPLNDHYSMQFMKQVFDIGELFDAATNSGELRAAYDAVFAAENRYRGEVFTRDQALDDAIATAYQMAQVGISGEPSDGTSELFEQGRKQLASHLVGSTFRREDMKVAAAKAALLTCAIRGDFDFADARYDETKQSFLKDYAFPDELAAIRRLKAIPEAMWYWSLVAHLNDREPN